ncbi:MAG: DUF2075 domain-containing protein [Coriobacteriia bacterium]|nr:DUF2075 domain-containing protein [Coriobacteriia bacterium]
MRADFSVLNVGTRYSRDDLARLWGLKGRQAISRGVVTPAGASQIILFVTESKTADMTEYRDQLVGDLLSWEGDGVECNLRRLERQLKNPPDQIYLFFRDTRPEEFIYCGEVTMLSADLAHPNGRFELRLSPEHAKSVQLSRECDGNTTGASLRPEVPERNAILRASKAASDAGSAKRAPVSATDSQRWGWAGTATRFLACDPAAILDRLRDHYRRLNLEEPTRSHDVAWRDSIQCVGEALRIVAVENPASRDWHLVFEYELSRERGRRPDLVVLAGGSIVVVEFKGYPNPSPAAIDQASDYARDLADYHEASHNHPVFATLCLTSGNAAPTRIKDVAVVSGRDLATGIGMCLAPLPAARAIDAREWLESEYAPLPSLVAAARLIFEHEELPHIRRAESAGIPETIAVLDRVAERAQSAEESHLVLVTGVPGAGKTLVGLQFVYESHFGAGDDKQKAVFLSGNGPLVDVLQHTLKSKVFVQGVLGFLRTYGGSHGSLPREHVWVFDEAQRAFDAEMALEKRGEAISEPEDFLRLGERLDSWALMVGLVGEGQEINRGEEAGIAQWNDALGTMDKPWHVHCPPALASVFTNAAETTVEERLSLDVTLRSHRAEEIHHWVSLLLDGDLEACRPLAGKLLGQGFELYVTRDLEAAKTYAQERYAGATDARYGLLASSKARNLLGYGFTNEYQFTKNMRVGPWFADRPESAFSCCSFRDTATEFQCQGLELDMPIIGWGHDLWWATDHWDCSTKYHVKDPRQLRMNAYRVLLTRGRDGFVVFVPPEPKYTPVWDSLVSAGCMDLSRVWI